MHDRRVGEQVYTFGNNGALWKNAMTWYDHETDSRWTQVWGRALIGELKGTQLRNIPFSLVPWETWRAEHPHTLALKPPDIGFYGQEPTIDKFVAGVAIGDLSRAYPYTVIAEEVVINDQLGSIPLLIHINPDTRNIHVFVRQLSDGRELTFDGDAERLVDRQTGSVWDPQVGLAIEGELAGEGLREIPYTPAFDWAWPKFYPDSDTYGVE